MIFKLAYLELLKTKRSLSLLMMFLSPLAVVFVNLMLFFNSEGKVIEEKGWDVFWATNYAMWGYFMLPLYIALTTALINGIEHNVNGWRFMLSLPIKAWHLFTAKLLVAVIFVCGTSLVFFCMIFVAIHALEFIGYQGSGAGSFDFIAQLFYSLIACLGILSIQHWVSWRWPSIIVPLTLGVIATMSVVQAASSRFWYYDPWTYILMATNASKAENQMLALILSFSVMLISFLLAKIWLYRREVTC